MNDNGQNSDEDYPPAWAWAIIEKHDLGLRADLPYGAVMVLLEDAGDFLKGISATIMRNRAVTSSALRRLRKVIDMLADAERLSVIDD